MDIEQCNNFSGVKKMREKSPPVSGYSSQALRYRQMSEGQVLRFLTDSLTSLGTHLTYSALLSPFASTTTLHRYHTIGALSYHYNNGRFISPLIPRRRPIIICHYYDSTTIMHTHHLSLDKSLLLYYLYH